MIVNLDKKKKIGRNDPCPCGSGKKYKKCCWLKEMKLKTLPESLRVELKKKQMYEMFEAKKEELSKKAREMFKNGASAFDIAKEFGWVYEWKNGWIRALPDATNLVLQLLGFKDWKEYKKCRNRILSKKRHDAGLTAKLKEEIKKRDRYKCFLCGAKRNLHVHHIDEDPTNNDPSNLVTLCEACHRLVHRLVRPSESEKLRKFVRKVNNASYLINVRLHRVPDWSGCWRYCIKPV